MKITKEVNAARRNRIWQELKQAFPEVHEYGLLQALLESLNLTYYKQGDFLHIQRRHYRADTTVETIAIHIKAVDVVVNRGLRSIDSDIGYIFTENKVWKPESLAAMKLIISTLIIGYSSN